MKTVFSFFSIILFSANVFPQSSYELTCRAKAKETAAQTYASCVTEARNNQVEQIRNSYQKELAALKSKYDRELKKMGAPVASEKSAAQTSKGLAKQLPSKSSSAKSSVHGENLPVQSVSEGAKVISVGTDKGSAPIVKEASDADQSEIIDMPTE